MFSLSFITKKSRFFNALTKSQATAENFPFWTIDPNESRHPVPDERCDFLCQFLRPASKVPAFVNVVDIVGPVKGVHMQDRASGRCFCPTLVPVMASSL
ncbi:hypothetical protein MATL_G00182930 [Megalops atlanticus]|uniref:G domain-containing protein n=1 Tax=Megalops atlanticus TaxID=7932 RepID=A0A9D3PQ25_MEGAT|nr:hypothetical protein MATL_G00182930 [Megalops atlanticus]